MCLSPDAWNALACGDEFHDWTQQSPSLRGLTNSKRGQS